MPHFEPPLLCNDCKHELDYDKDLYKYHEEDCLKYTCNSCSNFFFHDTGGMKCGDDVFCAKCANNTLILAEYLQNDCGLSVADAYTCLNDLKPI